MISKATLADAQALALKRTGRSVEKVNRNANLYGNEPVTGKRV